ncbi:hypothetical protein [Deinococcus sp. SL84]|uniref:hypothetical protein n=1 Tax=Deinococcus sp. SL84 TaxID=2994663 RepID=UPI0022752B31|nr:hypothetical protein [Deinococcus sp. SL84]MCY1704312.1 hypothetical protein [Deinococcus sp. SL84]
MTLDLTALKREARRKGTPPERLLELAGIGPVIARAVAASKYVVPEILVQLAESEDWVTRARVAHHRRTPLETLEKLAQDGEGGVLRNLLQNDRLPLCTLSTLAAHPNELVHEGVDRALARALLRGRIAEEDAQTLRELAGEYPYLRPVIARYWRQIPPDLAVQWLSDPDGRVRNAILRRQTRTRPIYRCRRGSSHQLAQPLPLEAVLPLLNDEKADIRELAAQVIARMTQLIDNGVSMRC